MVWGLRFQTWRAPRPSERRKKCTKRGFRGTRDACESFVWNTPCPEECFCYENMVNNKVLTRAPFSQSCSKRVAQGSPKVSFGGPFGHLGLSRDASWSTLDTTWRQQDAALRTDVFPGPKLVPDPLPKRSSAAQAEQMWERGQTHI